MTVARESLGKKFLLPAVMILAAAVIVLFVPPDNPLPVFSLITLITIGFYSFLRVFTLFYYAILGSAIIMTILLLLYFDVLYSLNLIILIVFFMAVSLLIRQK